MIKLIRFGTIAQLIVLPDDEHQAAMELIRRMHLEAMGFKFMDDQHPMAQHTPEG